MKTIKKIYFVISLITVAALMEGCEDALDLSPVSSVTDANYWKTPEQFETFITGIHSRLRTHAFTLEQLGEFRSDLYGETSDGSIVFERWHLNTLNAEYTGLSSFGGFYTNINQINLFIARTLPSDLVPEKDKNYYLGQAYGMRALYYFHLLRSWGDLVLHKAPSTSFDFDNLAKAASPASEVMNSIKQDIDSSAYYFANDYSFKTKVFWSKAATLMLQSEVYLWSARQMGGGATDATKAKAALTEIQTNIPALGLLPNFKDVFAYANKENKEIIFAIRFKLNEYNFMGGNYTQFLRRWVSVSNYYDSIGNRKLNTNDDLLLTEGGSHYVSPHTYIWRQFSDADSRKLESIQAAYKLENDQYVKVTGCWVSKFKGTFDLGLRIMSMTGPFTGMRIFCSCLQKQRAFWVKIQQTRSI